MQWEVTKHGSMLSLLGQQQETQACSMSLVTISKKSGNENACWRDDFCIVCCKLSIRLIKSMVAKGAVATGCSPAVRFLPRLAYHVRDYCQPPAIHQVR